MGNCDSRWAESWQFASFWCVSSILAGADDSGTNNKDHLSNSQADFVDEGVRPNVGMVIYNLTDGSSGVITAVDATTIHAALTGGTDNDWDSGDRYRLVPITANEIATIEMYLDIAASDIHAALAASGACDCHLASWAANFLAKLNIIDAVAYYRCPCAKPDISDDARAAYLEWMNLQLDNIRTQKLELCGGATGTEFPAIDWASQSKTEFAAAEIIFGTEEAAED